MNEHIQLYDTSLSNSGFLTNTKGAKLYKNMSNISIEKTITDILRFTQGLCHEDAKTIPEVTMELEHLYDALRSRREELTKNYKKKSRNQRCSSNTMKTVRSFQNLIRYSKDLANLSSFKELIPSTNDYYLLFGVIKSLSLVKKDILQGKQQSKENTLYTDQHLVTQALYQVLFEGNSVEIITNDFDISRLVLASKELFNNDYYALLTPTIANSLQDNSLKVSMPRFDLHDGQRFFKKRARYTSFSNQEMNNFLQQSVHFPFVKAYLD